MLGERDGSLLARACPPSTSKRSRAPLSPQRTAVQANSSSGKAAGPPAGTVPQQLQVHGVQQSVPVAPEVPGWGTQQLGGEGPGRGAGAVGLCRV